MYGWMYGRVVRQVVFGAVAVGVEVEGVSVVCGVWVGWFICNAKDRGTT